MKITENVPLSELTTMRLGGPARFLIEIETKDDIPEAYEFAKSHNLPTFILGGGANTIARDEGFPGIIFKNTMCGISEVNDQKSLFEGPPERGSARMSAPRPWQTAPWDADDPKGRRAEATQPEKRLFGHLTIMGGTPWDSVVEYACERGLTGIEAMSKIPGTAGAAPVQNIGAYGQDISQTLDNIEVYDSTTGKFKTLTNSDLHFSYRHSLLNTTEKDRYFVISITLKLHPGELSRPFYNSIEQYITDHHETDFSPKNIRRIVSTIRENKLPDPTTTPSAGSFFKNIYLTEKQAKEAEANHIPVYHGHDGFKINSGWLIENAGLKGKLLHGIRVSDKAALVLINESAKSYQDLAAARTEIINAVKTKFGFHLEQEPVELWKS